MKIEGSVALVTGSNRGIGREIARALLAAGVAKVYATSRGGDAPPPPDLADPGRWVSFALDIRDPAQVAAAVERCGDVTLLVNNAGINLYAPLLSDSAHASARSEMETNYFGTLAMCRAFAPVLRRQGGGAVVNMLSILCRVNMPSMGSLCASKAATWSLTQGVRGELRSNGTLVVGVMPGAVDTDMSRNYPGPKAPPQLVAAAIIDALRDDLEEVYPDEMAKGLAAGLAHDPRAVERQVGAYV